MKMSGLCWIAGMLIFLLSAGNSFADVNNKQLEHFVRYIMDRYDIKNQESVAVNIPLQNAELNLVNYRNKRKAVEDLRNKDSNPKSTKEEVKFRRLLIESNKKLKIADDKLLAEVLTKASAAAVSAKLSDETNPVYPGDNSDSSVVVAKPRLQELYTDHAEALVLANIDPLVKDSKDKMLVFYSYNSPCGEKCANKYHKYNILTKMKEIIPNWKTHAFVFSQPFDKTLENGRIEALKELGNSIGNDSIFRCYQPLNLEYRCIKCIKGTNIEKDCVEVKPGQIDSHVKVH